MKGPNAFQAATVVLVVALGALSLLNINASNQLNSRVDGLSSNLTQLSSEFAALQQQYLELAGTVNGTTLLDVTGATLSEATAQSNALFTIEVANLGAIPVTGLTVSIMGFDVPMSPDVLNPHDVSSGEVTLNLSCTPGQRYQYSMSAFTPTGQMYNLTGNLTCWTYGG
jgi:hypothetical protein